MQLEIEQASIRYAKLTAVDTVSLQLDKGEIGCLLGPSGCGKTSLLRAIAGFEPLAHGRISIDGKLLSKAGWNCPPEKRHIGMIFQDFALFPHLSVADNIAFGLSRPQRTPNHPRVLELLDMVAMRGYASAYPHVLSGGQQQRIALARALAPRPKLLLLDEPFGSQDAELREQLAREVRDLLRSENVTALLVTHDQFEAFAFADQIGVLNQGRLCQLGSGYDLYHRPADPFVADFIGQGEFVRGTVINTSSVTTPLGIIEGKLPEALELGAQVRVLVRPDDVIHDDGSEWRAKVVARAFRGAEFLYTLALPDSTSLLCLAPSHHDHQLGELIGIRLEIDHLVVFAESEMSA